MIGQLCDNSSEATFGQHLTISVHRGLLRCPCPLQARELLTSIDCIQDVIKHVDFCLLTFGQLPSSCYLFLQPMSQHVESVACFAFTSQLVQRDHPTLWEGFRALLAIQATCKDDQVISIDTPSAISSSCKSSWVSS